MYYRGSIRVSERLWGMDEQTRHEILLLAVGTMIEVSLVTFAVFAILSR